MLKEKKLMEMIDETLNKFFPKDSSNPDEDDEMEDSYGSMGMRNQFEGTTPIRKKKLSDSSGKVDNDSTPYLDKFSFDMTAAARESKFDPVVGRITELGLLSEILSCRKKNNAILLGDPGVGKTSVVEALAQKIVSKEVPRDLLNKRICSLDLNALVSGTKFRGEYEARLQGIIKEVINHKEIIIYIDEFHNLVGNGSSSGGGDGSNILKPYLSRGEFQCIGSTTLEEYRKFVEKDGALKRRFQNIYIDQPSLQETKEILKNIQGKYEEHHKVKYSEEAIINCVDWSGRYITDRFFPDKAIDALDLSGSRLKLDQPKNIEKIKEIETNINQVSDLKRKSILGQDFEKAAEYRDKEVTLKKQLEKEFSSSGDIKTWPIVGNDIMAEVIGKISGVPIEKIGKTDMEKLRVMKTTLENSVIGQEEAINEVVKALQRNSLGLRDPKKPIASMLLVGPTGSGKTHLCKTLATEFFGSEESLIKFDMSEFSEKHEVTKLTGATATYVGYEDTPLLEQIRRKPYSVILFDEIEKAAPEIYQIFLSILDEGIITLGNGIKVDFKNTIIVFTGNVGTKELSLHGTGLGFSKETTESVKKTTEDIVLKAVKKTFKPEYINRLSKIIVFNNLTQDNMMKIFDLEIKKLHSRLTEKGYKLKISEELKKHIISSCDLQYGARDLQRNIVKFIEDSLCSELLILGNESKKDISMDWKEEKINIVLL